ncbi:MAG: J domain-containing protein, partial [Dehalococcoidales bacterium]|nr:J domain-containing protein [Dehalococcoidales bacterium]
MNFEEACHILGVPTTANAEEIHAQYIYKAQLLHPDKTVNLPERVRHKAEEELKRTNEAYNILKNLENSPADIAPKLKIDPLFISFKDLSPGEKQTARIRVDNTGGAFTRFWTDDSPAPWLKVSEVKSTTANPLPL